MAQIRVLLILAVCLSTPVINAVGASKARSATWQKLKRCAYTLGLIALGGYTVVPLSLDVGTELYSFGEKPTRPLSSLWKGRHRLHYGDLTPLWTQEYIGADALINAADLPAISVAVVDGGFFTNAIPPETLDLKLFVTDPYAEDAYHGTAVANLIVHPVFGVNPHAKLVALDSSYSRGRNSFIGGFRAVMQLNPRLINVSLLPFLRPGFLEESLSTKTNGSIIIVAGGNYPVGYSFITRVMYNISGLKFPIIQKNADIMSRAPVISVGSLSPSGHVSEFSQNKTVTIYAPADSLQQTITGPDLNSADFGGTSGATPLTTGALSLGMSVLEGLTPSENEKVTLPEATALLVGTATRLHDSIRVVNAVRLLEVARRLKETGWPKNRNRLFSDPVSPREAINPFAWQTSIFNFSGAAQEHYKRGIELIGRSDLAGQLEGETELRRAVLLHPTQLSIKALSQFYANFNFEGNALFYKRINPAE